MQVQSSSKAREGTGQNEKADAQAMDPLFSGVQTYQLQESLETYAYLVRINALKFHSVKKR